MALIKCPECGREISNKAAACIHCGCPIHGQFEISSNPSADIEKREIAQNAMLGDDLRAEQKYLAALECYQKAANLGDAHSQLWVGVMYDRGFGVEVDHAEAAKWYQKAAEQGNADALCNLAMLYKSGIGVEQNYQKAIELNLQAISKGSATAAGNLGSLYDLAPDGMQSHQLARKYYEQAIALGTTQYSYYNNLGVIYAEGKQTPVNFIKAEQCYLKAIELGSTQAKSNYMAIVYNLAALYEKGDSVAQDYAKAEQYYLKAIELGATQAKEKYGIFANNRGVMYADGKGVEPNYAKAEHYYLIAIKYGNQQAQRNYELLKRQKKQYVRLEKQQEKEEWRQRLTCTCPRCGRHTGHPINEFEKKLSVSFWGYASNKWGKSYKCDSCDYMW